MYVVSEGRLWIPVEITLFAKSFMEAWRSGAGECARLAARESLRTVTTRELYEPAPPRFAMEIQPPPKEVLKPAFEEGRAGIEDLMQTYIDEI